ncbi:HGxxPAAW family protein [Rothia kristinae]|uniref:HGxxPAAW family protein n=1 Tax=Rothia kristinae TaxID=37923 RepID=UPI000735FA67|nr:HGxxPAAW family protein [Rothia kristinae]KTR37721.1 hypothetical protein RSA5_06940 [Rothia kristinae]KTR59799.1 hypothetical protein SA11R_02500 [Rothia kristinae]KTR69029.1 hypothetical protein SA12R_04165 [Rothia kristinae]KTR73264.1 hypothetical protein SA15R_05515 [Rothia kristinae]KTR81010.1 hypothetical protein RSA28_03250 [Rothia kristinae]
MTYDNPDVLVSEPVKGHGSTVAAWFLVIVTTIGLIVATVAFDTFHLVGMCVGFGIMIVGLGGSAVLKALGYGKDGKHTLARARSAED